MSQQSHNVQRVRPMRARKLNGCSGGCEHTCPIDGLACFGKSIFDREGKCLGMFLVKRLHASIGPPNDTSVQRRAREGARRATVAIVRCNGGLAGDGDFPGAGMMLV